MLEHVFGGRRYNVNCTVNIVPTRAQRLTFAHITITHSNIKTVRPSEVQQMEINMHNKFVGLLMIEPTIILNCCSKRLVPTRQQLSYHCTDKHVYIILGNHNVGKSSANSSVLLGIMLNVQPQGLTYSRVPLPTNLTLY